MTRKNLLKGIKKPKGITFEQSIADSSYGSFSAYPFERGYGTTIGNTLRRILLSSIQGYAVSSVRVTSYNEDGVAKVLSSEFEPVPHIVEDTPVIISNLKSLKLNVEDEAEEVTVHLEWKGKGTLTGADLEKNGVIVANRDQPAQSVLLWNRDAWIWIFK